MSKLTLSSDVPSDIAEMLGKDGKKKKGKLSKKKKIIISCVSVVTAAAIAVGTVLIVRSRKSDTGETVYREYSVERGNIIVGLTESSVITLDRETIDFPVNAEVLDVYVKAGTQVKTGDKLIKLSTDDINDSLGDYEKDIDTAKATLDDAELKRSSELLKAQQELENSELNGDLASSNLSSSLNKATLDLESKKTALSDAQEEYDNLKDEQESFDYDKAKLDLAETLVDTTQSTVDSCQNTVDNYNDLTSQLNSINSDIKEIADVSDMEQAEALLDELKEEYDNMYASYYSTSDDSSESTTKSSVKLTELLKAEEKYNNLSSSMTKLKVLFTKQAYYEGRLSLYDGDAINKKLDNAKEALETATANYKELSENFKDTYGTVTTSDEMTKAVDTSYASLQKAQLDYDNQQISYKTAVLAANQSSDTTAQTASAAQKEYQLKALELDNTVQEAQDSYDDLVDTLQEIKDALTNDGIILAPCSGVVSSIAVEKGDTVTVNSSSSSDSMSSAAGSSGSSSSGSSVATLMSITDTSEVYVSVSVSEDDILNVSLDQKASVSMSAFTDRTFDATVETISVEGATLGAATVTYTVTVKFPGESDLELYDGMSADVTLIQSSAMDVLYLDKQAITVTDSKSTVLLKGSDDKGVETQITTGFSDGQYVEITSGLSEGDTVLVASALGATDASGDKASGDKASDGAQPSDTGNSDMPENMGNMGDFSMPSSQ